MTAGYAGKILRLDLTNQTSSIIETKDYEQYGGGHGIGSALFWDLCADKLPFDAFDPQNVVTVMASPLSGTMVPAGGSRTEVQGIGAQGYPTQWFCRSNFGGRFSGELKFAGWDGIAIEGKAENPVWINIIDDKVTFEDASSLWGTDTWATQQKIWDMVAAGKGALGDWLQTDTKLSSGRTTQKPAVLCCGPAGEAMLKELGALIHDAGYAAGQGGFGAVWGSKNLKAISVVGTGSVAIADPNALIEARLWSYNFCPAYGEPGKGFYGMAPGGNDFGAAKPIPTATSQNVGCMNCNRICHGPRTADGIGNESHCGVPLWYSYGGSPEESLLAADIVQKYGANYYPMNTAFKWLIALNEMGILGKGMQIDTELPLDLLLSGDSKFVTAYIEHLIAGKDIGLDLKDGNVSAADKWGRIEDLNSGLLSHSYWGWPEHGYDARCQVEWGYGSILGERDINEHEISFGFYLPLIFNWFFGGVPITAGECADIWSEKLVPYQGDPMMINFATDNIYSEHMVKLVAWHRHYSRFYKQGLGFCDMSWPNIVNVNAPDNIGISPEGESKFYNAVTGNNLSFADGMEIGRKIWNIDNAIWTLQGRHRDMVYMADYEYESGRGGWGAYNPFGTFYPLPTYEDGTWDFRDVAGRNIDRAKFDDFKTLYYGFEGWDVNSGWPTRATLEELDLQNVADLLEAKGKLGGA